MEVEPVTELEDLPDGVLADVLVQLTADVPSLLRASCVCRRWRAVVQGQLLPSITSLTPPGNLTAQAMVRMLC